MKWIVNGEVYEEQEARISSRNRGALFGDGLFETFRVEKGIPLFLNEHLVRLVQSAEKLRFTHIPDEQEFKRAIREAIRWNQVKSGYLRLTLTRGNGGFAVPLKQLDQPCYWVEARELPLKTNLYDQGIRAIVSYPICNPLSPTSGTKSLQFLDNIMARDDAEKKGVQEAILRTVEGDLCEGASSNLFLVRDGVIRTPALNRGPLPGIVRAWVIQTAHQLGLTVEESRLEPEELHQADEVFLTNSSLGVFPCVQVNGRFVGHGVPGPVTRRLIRAWKETVMEQTKASF